MHVEQYCTIVQEENGQYFLHLKILKNAILLFGFYNNFKVDLFKNVWIFKKMDIFKLFKNILTEPGKICTGLKV